MADFSNYKLVKGSANVLPVEDPVRGSNGTAVINRINNFIDVVEDEFNTYTPGTKGSLVTRNTAGHLTSLNPGTNGQVLVADSNAPNGLVYQTRVDLTSNQTIAGIKTFENLVANQLTVTNLELEEIDVNSINISGSLEVNQNSTFLGSSNFEGLSSFNNLESFNLDTTTLNVQGASTFNGAVNFNNSFNINNNLVIGNNLTVANSTNLENLTVVNNSSFRVIYATQSISCPNSITGSNLVSSNSTTVGSNLNVADDVTVGRNLSVSNNLSVLTNATITGNLTVSGTANLPNLNIPAASKTVTGVVQLVDDAASINKEEGTKALTTKALFAALKLPLVFDFKRISAASYTVTSTDYFLVADTLVQAITLNLPAISSVSPGQILVIKDAGNASVNNLTVVGTSGATIDGQASRVLNTNFARLFLIATNSEWFIL